MMSLIIFLTSKFNLNNQIILSGTVPNFILFFVFDEQSECINIVLKVDPMIIFKRIVIV